MSLGLSTEYRKPIAFLVLILTHSFYILDMIVFISIFGIVALSLNLEYSFAGLGNFGKVAFFSIGAYTYAILIKSGLPFFFALIAAVLMAGIMGLLVSLPALRLRTDYLAIVTLTYSEILRLIVKTEHWLAGGVWGIYYSPYSLLSRDVHREMVLVLI